MKRSRFVVLVAVLCASSAGLLTASPQDLGPSLEALLAQGPDIVGEEVRLSFHSPAYGGPRGKASERLVWTQELRDPGSSYIAPYFGQFDLPPGARVVVRSPDGARSWEYRARGKSELAGQGFWGLHIPGDAAIVELYSSVDLRAGAVTIASYARGFPGGSIAPGPESICGSDDSDWAQCFQVSEPAVYSKSAAVARLLINGTSACTGWLVGDQGHLITNEHCIGSASAALNTDYEFAAEGSCNTNCTTFGGCPGTVVATSATLIQLDSALDYALVQLPTNPTGTYGFMQMRGSGAVVGERIYLPGHPAAWGKRIAVDSSHPSDPSGRCEVFSLNESACSGGPGDIGYYCDTQGGSSGSPVLAYADHTVVSLHHCRGNTACTTNGGNANRGVPVEAIIADLGGNLPNNAVVGGNPPPPPPPPPCLSKGASCTSDSQCCSNKCKGKSGSKTCK